MKNFNLALAFCLAFVLLLTSCDKDSDIEFSEPAFKLEFTSGTVITENDLLYYDASSHLFYLKNDFDEESLSDFSVKINEETIYQGMIVSSASSAMPNSSYYIGDGFFHGNNILEIGSSIDSEDLRNDKRIVDAK